MSGTRGLIEIDTEREIEAIIQKLRRLPDQIAAPNILKNAINATARQVRKQLVKGAKERYAIQKTKVLKDVKEGAPKVYTATAANLEAEIKSKGPMQSITTFLTRPNSATGAAAAQVLNQGTMKALTVGGLKAFVTTFASGHTAIVQRNPPGQYSAGRSARESLYGKSADMTKLKKLLSPAVPHMLGNEEVRGEAEEMAIDILHKEIQKRIDAVLSRG